MKIKKNSEKDAGIINNAMKAYRLEGDKGLSKALYDLKPSQRSKVKGLLTELSYLDLLKIVNGKFSIAIIYDGLLEKKRKIKDENEKQKLLTDHILSTVFPENNNYDDIHLSLKKANTMEFVHKLYLIGILKEMPYYFLLLKVKNKNNYEGNRQQNNYTHE